MLIGLCSLVVGLLGCSSGGGGGGFTSSSSVGVSSSSSSSVVDVPPLANGFNPPSNWEELFAADPLMLSDDQLKAAYWGYALSQYSGSEGSADLSLENIQTFYSFKERSGDFDKYRSPRVALSPTLASDFGGAGIEPYATSVANYIPTGEIQTFDEQLVEGFGGIAEITGELIDGAGSLLIKYDNYPVLGSGFTYLTGNGVISGFPSSYFVTFEIPEINGIFAFESVTVNSTLADQPVELVISGFSEILREGEGADNALTTAVAIVYEDSATGEELVEFTDSNGDGFLAIDGLGRVDMETIYNPSAGAGVQTFEQDPAIKTTVMKGISGISAKITEFRWFSVLVTLDGDGDGNFEQGRYFTTAEDLIYGDLSETPLRDIADINHPPVIINDPYWVGFPSLDAETISIDLSESDYFDPDTLSSDLEVKVVWSINFQVVEGVDGPSLMSDLLKPFDILDVYYTVSDGSHTVTSRPESWFVSY
jgi:hypothetical protein